MVCGMWYVVCGMVESSLFIKRLQNVKCVDSKLVTGSQSCRITNLTWLLFGFDFWMSIFGLI